MNKSTPSTKGTHTTKTTRIMDCVCQSDYQDKRYGKGQRVHNPRKDNGWACTVCGRVEKL